MKQQQKQYEEELKRLEDDEYIAELARKKYFYRMMERLYLIFLSQVKAKGKVKNKKGYIDTSFFVI